MAPLVTLLTDFGTSDPYVGVMKGAILARCPAVTTLDLTHEIERHRIGSASFWLERAHTFLPKGTVHLVVVDPGVGTDRSAIALEAGGHIFVAPDNGALGDVMSRYGEMSAVILDRNVINPDGRVGTTFDGRDLFAPAAGLLARGVPLNELGPAVSASSLTRLSRCDTPSVRVIDHYGNLITDAQIPPDRNTRVRIGEREIPWATTYAEGRPGQAIALRGSWKTIEIAVNQGNAAEVLNAEVGQPIALFRDPQVRDPQA